MGPTIELAKVESVGDVGFRIDRTVSNQQPTGHVFKVNGTQVISPGNSLSGLPTVTFIKPGPSELVIYCITSGRTYALPTIHADLEKGKKYELRCAAIDGRAKAWLTPA